MQSTALTPLGVLTGVSEAQRLASLPNHAGQARRSAWLGCFHHNQTLCR